MHVPRLPLALVILLSMPAAVAFAHHSTVAYETTTVSFKGAVVGSLLLGQVQSFGVALLPEFTNPLVFLVMAVVLIVRPNGIFGAVPRRS